MNIEDLKHLNLLATFHYVVGGIIGLFSLFPLIHLFVGISMLRGGFVPDGHSGQENTEFPIELFGLMFTLIPLVFIIGGMALAVCTIIAGRKLARKQGYTYCFVVAAFLCTFMPFGTVLGIFTIIVLSRESVKKLFVQEDI